MFCLFALSKRICIEALIGNKIKEGGYALCTLCTVHNVHHFADHWCQLLCNAIVHHVRCSALCRAQFSGLQRIFWFSVTQCNSVMFGEVKNLQWTPGQCSAV